MTESKRKNIANCIS